MIEIIFFIHYNDNKPLPAQSINVRPKRKNKILFISEFSSEIRLGFKFIWKNQLEENAKIIIRNLYINEIT